jgi:hypothetical protein
VGSFRTIGCGKGSFGLHQPFDLLHNPSADSQALARPDVAPESDPQFARQRFTLIFYTMFSEVVDCQ